MTYPSKKSAFNQNEGYNPDPRYDPAGPTQPQLGQVPRPDFPQYSVPVSLPYVPTRLTPVDPKGYSQPIRTNDKRRSSFRLPWKGGCCALVVVLGIFFCLAAAFVAAALILSPGKTNILVLGIDRVDSVAVGDIGRSDTIVMAQIDPVQPHIATLAIPRDLWVNIPGVGENRINTAHFFAEADKPGSGPAALAQTIQDNFAIPSTFYIRIHLEGIPAAIDAMGGVTINLTEATALYPVGVHHLDGTEALAFVRDRKGADDFFRMAYGQIFIKAAAQQMLNPLTWLRLPFILAALPQAFDTNIPATHMPALGLALLRVGPSNIESHTLPREDTTPYTTSAGAQVLLPKWNLINALVKQVFGN